MTELRDFSIGAAASVTTGFMLCPLFSEVHELMEWLTGFPIWTHQIPRLSGELKALALAHHAELPTRETIGEVNPDNCQEVIARLEAKLGPMMSFKKGDGNLAERKDPVDEAVEMMGRDRVVVVKPE